MYIVSVYSECVQLISLVIHCFQWVPSPTSPFFTKEQQNTGFWENSSKFLNYFGFEFCIHSPLLDGLNVLIFGKLVLRVAFAKGSGGKGKDMPKLIQFV